EKIYIFMEICNKETHTFAENRPESYDGWTRCSLYFIGYLGCFSSRMRDKFDDNISLNTYCLPLRISYCLTAGDKNCTHTILLFTLLSPNPFAHFLYIRTSISFLYMFFFIQTPLFSSWRQLLFLIGRLPLIIPYLFSAFLARWN